MKPRLPRISMLVAVVAVLVLVTDRAAAAEKGGISGNVLTLDGKPAVGFLVKLVKDVPMITNPGGKGAAGSGGSGGPRIIAQVTTDPSGRFTLKDVEPGTYRLEGGNGNSGWLYEDVTVDAAKTVEKKDCKLFKLG